LADLAAAVGRRSSDDVVSDVVDIVTYVEAPWGLDLQLYPIQRVILKVTYGIELDDNAFDYPLDEPVPEDHPYYDAELMDPDGFYKYRIVVTDWRKENPRHMTEAGYLEFLYNEGRCNVKEVIPGQQRRDMVLSVGRRSGKCVVGDTMVLTDLGVFPIRDLGDPEGPEIQPLNVGVAQEGSRKRARSSHFYNGGVKPTFRVKTHCGYSIEGTANHRVKVMGTEGVIRWAYLDEIREGDQIAIHRGTDLWAEGLVDAVPFHNDKGRKDLNFPEEITPEWGYLLGILVGDGCWTLKNRVEVTVGDVEYREKVESVFASLLGDVKYKPDLRRVATGQVQSNSHGWREFLHDLGWSTDCGPRDKEVPWAILRSPKEVVASFLRGLFDADGGVESDGKVVSFCSASERLAQQVQILLLNLGVVSRVKAKWNAEYQRDYYFLTVRGRRSRQAYADHVCFTLSHKRGPLLSSLEKSSREGGNTESIPHLRPWASRLLQLVPRKAKGGGWGRSHLRAALGNTLKPSSLDEMTGPRLEKSLRVALDLGADLDVVQHLQGILDADYFYDPVVSVGESEARVYDLTVPEGHMFVANGMTNHNTLITSCIVAYEAYKLLLKGNPQKYYGFSQSNVIQLISVATDKDQAALLYQEAAGHFQKCLAAETEIITDEGVRPIGGLAGQTVTLLTREGAWVEAPIHSYGVQQLYKVVLRRQGVRKVVHATAEHRWFARDERKAFRGKGYQEFITKELRPEKHRLQATFGRSYKNRIHPSPFGVAHGFTFGDGCRTQGERNSTYCYLFGEKDLAILPYFSQCPQRPIAPDSEEMPAAFSTGHKRLPRREAGVEVGALPNFFKDFPPLKENKAYLLGWVAGYFAADGSVSAGQAVINSASRENIEFFRDVCVLLGIGTYAIRVEDRTSNITGQPHRMFKMGLMRPTLDESFFLLPSHQEAFLAAGGSEVRRLVSCWTVESVEPTDRVEEVFCAAVDGSRSFVLEGNIATGNCDFFRPYAANSTQTFATFQTPYDIDQYGSYKENPKARYSVKVTFRSCVAKGLRGGNNVLVALDEAAHFGDKGQASADEVYQAVSPSAKTFLPKDPENKARPIGPNEGRMIMISSPLGKQGLFYKQFRLGFEKMAGKNILSFQAPTWEVNPTIDGPTFQGEYLKDPTAFFTEFGAEFTDRTRGWIEDKKDLLACIDPILRPKVMAPPRAPHFMGLDVALAGDYTAIAVGHNDPSGVVVLDYIDRICAGEGDYVDLERLEFEDVADWVRDVSKRFYIHEGIFDQWSGIPMEQALARRGLGQQLKSVHHTRQLSSQMFQNFKNLMLDKKVALYDFPIPDGEEHSAHIQELLELQAEVISKYIIKVEAPNMQGKHDDLSDALIRMVWVATQNAGRVHSVRGIRTQKGFGLGGSSITRFAQKPHGTRSGSHPSRMTKNTKRR